MRGFLLNIDLPDRFIQAFCWMLLHSIWEGLVLTILTALVILLTKKQPPVLRYNILTTLFFSFLVVCFITFIHACTDLHGSPNVQNQSNFGNSNSLFLINSYELQRLLVVFTDYCSIHADVIVISWFIIFLFKVKNMISGMYYIRVISNTKISMADDFWRSKVAYLSSKLMIKKQVQLLESSLVKIPVVAGYFKPVIFMPVGLLANLPANQVEAVLLHELAHVRRNDYFINLLQHVAETVFFFNPALLWVSSLMKEERENCCDDITLDHTKNKKQFLEALISFREFSSSGESAYAIAFPGKGNLLKHRFKRIITDQNKSLVGSEKLFFIFSLMMCVVLLIAATTNSDRKAFYDKDIVARITTPDITSVLQQDDLVREKIQSPAERIIKTKVLMISTVKKRSSVPQKQDKILKQDIAFQKDANNEPEEKSSGISGIEEEQDMQALLSKQEAEKVRQKSLTERQLAEQQKIESIRDAHQAYADRLQAEMHLQRARYEQEEAFKKKKQAELAAQDAYQKRLATQYNK